MLTDTQVFTCKLELNIDPGLGGTAMWILIVAIVLLGLKLAAIGPFANLSWWWVGVPLALVFLWWEIIDPMFAVSQKRAQREMDDRRKERNERARRFLGMRPRK